MMALAVLLLLPLTGALDETDPDFIRPAEVDPDLVWGLREGIRFSIWPHSVMETPDDGGPRGLLRIGYPVMPDGAYWLVNFIAVEPIVGGHRGFSELEHSAGDGRRGLTITPDEPLGRIVELEDGARRLEVVLRVERFANGARVHLTASVRTDRPDEVELRTHAAPDSAPLESCILTATMGNFERLRILHLQDGPAHAGDLFPGHTGDGFTHHATFPLEDLPRAADGSIVVAATTDEDDPAATRPSEEHPWAWYYPGRKVTQYWRVADGDHSPALVARVNARVVYWASRLTIPGGVSFENLELGDAFRDGQAFVFGVTPKEPGEVLRSP